MKLKTKLTPVRYPGGKSNALTYLNDYFPKSFKEYREPFFGGGSVGLYLMQSHKDTTYYINDLFYPVYSFWKSLYEKPDDMVKFILEKRNEYLVPNDKIVKGVPSKSSDNGRTLHELCKLDIEKSINDKDEFTTGCLWYILNKTSYSGMAMIGSYAPLAWDQNFSENCITNLPKTNALMKSVKEVVITNKDCTELLHNTGDDVFIFLDPPYKIPINLYGKKGNMHKNFNHNSFADSIKQCSHRWMITYNSDDDIKTWFKDYHMHDWLLTYTMRQSKKGNKTVGKEGKELLIWNY